MIVDSYYWKRDLVSHAKKLAKRRKQKKWQDASYADSEKSVMLGYYAIRKLIEAHKVSDQVKGMQVKVIEFPLVGAFGNLLNWHKLEEHYDLANPTKADLRLKLVANQVIHSYVFVHVLSEEGGLEGFYLASDRERKKKLLYLPLLEVIKCFAAVAKEYPSKMEMQFNPISGDFESKIQ